MTLIHCTPLLTMIVTKRLLQTDNAKHQCLMLLSDSTSLSQYPVLRKNVTKQKHLSKENG